MLETVAANIKDIVRIQSVIWKCPTVGLGAGGGKTRSKILSEGGNFAQPR